jgi:hypothetical protein
MQESQGMHDSSMLVPASVVHGIPPASHVHEMIPEIASPAHHVVHSLPKGEGHN